MRRTSLLLAVILPGLALAGRRDRDKLAESVDTTPVASASEIPALAELLGKAGWTPTPELSGTFEAGAIFSETVSGHQLALEGCFAVAPKESTYTQAEVMTQLQAGVSVSVGMGSVSGSAGIVKKVKFGTPVHYALPALEMVPTEACREKLGRAGSMGQDLSQMYVIKEALFAEIAEQTCGQIDASGRFVGLGAADVEVSMACAQASLEPVAVAYRTQPVTSLPGVGGGSDQVVSGGSPVGVISTTTGAFGGSLDVSGALAEQACQEAAQSGASRQRASKVEASAASLAREATSAWSRLEGDASSCLELKDVSSRAPCIEAVSSYIASAEGLSVTVTEGFEEVETDGPVGDHGVREGIVPGRA
jgi:hypothetical protein